MIKKLLGALIIVLLLIFCMVIMYQARDNKLKEEEETKKAIEETCGKYSMGQKTYGSVHLIAIANPSLQ